MEPQQLHELATNATLNHWPPHLGVVSEQDKIQYLADRLREATDSHSNELEAAEQRVEYLEGESIELEQKIDRLEDENEKLESKVADRDDQIVNLKQSLKEAEETIAQLEARL